MTPMTPVGVVMARLSSGEGGRVNRGLLAGGWHRSASIGCNVPAGTAQVCDDGSYASSRKTTFPSKPTRSLISANNLLGVISPCRMVTVAV